VSEYATVPAGRNVVHNPKPASLTNISSSGTAALTQEASFSGLTALRVELGASQTFLWSAASNDDPDLAAISPGSSVFFSVRVMGTITGAPITTFRIIYTDGTNTTANLVLPPGLNDDTFTRTPTPGTLLATSGLPVAAGKTVRNAQLLLDTGSIDSFSGFLGGFEVRVNQPIDSFIHGDGGDGYAWEGTPNDSPSTREAFVANPIFGSGGQYTPTLTAEVVSRQGQTLRDITDHFLDGSITYDLDADQHKGSCNVVFNEPGLVEVLGDEWLKLSLRVERPDGSVEEGPLGVFILEPPKETWTEGADQWVYPGKDITALLSATYIRGVPQVLVLPEGDEEIALLGAYVAEEGTSYWAVLEDVLINDVGLTRVQFTFHGLSQFFDETTGWESYTSVMQIATDTLEGAGWMSPWAMTHGILTSAPAGINPATVAPSLVVSTGNNSRVRWPFEVDVEAGGIGNRVRVISAKNVTSITRRRNKKKKKTIRTTSRHVVEVWRMNNDPSHPLSYPRLGRWIDIPDVTQPLVQNETEATALADQALIEAGQLPVRVRLVTEAMVRGLNEVYDLDLSDHTGEPIPSGQGRYWCRGWSMQLGPPWEMVHNLSRTIDFRAASFVSE
jgi:hypothetical protein